MPLSKGSTNGRLQRCTYLRRPKHSGFCVDGAGISRGKENHPGSGSRRMARCTAAEMCPDESRGRVVRRTFCTPQRLEMAVMRHPDSQGVRSAAGLHVRFAGLSECAARFNELDGQFETRRQMVPEGLQAIGLCLIMAPVEDVQPVFLCQAVGSLFGFPGDQQIHLLS